MAMFLSNNKQGYNDIILGKLNSTDNYDPIRTMDSLKNRAYQNDRINVPFRVVSFSSNQILLEVDNTFSKPVILAYSDAWHPNWKAWIEDNETEVIQTNFMLKSVVVPVGKHFIKFEYKPGCRVFFCETNKVT